MNESLVHSRRELLLEDEMKTDLGIVRLTYLRRLFKAKCADLGIHVKPEMYDTFYAHCKKSITGSKVNFSGMELGMHSVKVVSDMLKRLPISSLDVSQNHLGNKGVLALLSGITKNTTLFHLNIGCNDLSSEGLGPIISRLKKLPSLTSVSFSNSHGLNRNKLGNKGAEAVGELL